MFKKLNLPNIKDISLPEDINLQLPRNPELKNEDWHFLVEIPWEQKYLDLVPREYQDFFEYVLPYLKVRTTDVHTAICVSLIPRFKTQFRQVTINWRVITLALILHDCGWSQLTQAEIAQSLGVTGLALTPGAKGPKLAHAEAGAKLAQQLLANFVFDQALTSDEIELITKCVLYHDQPEMVAGHDLPLEVQILVDLDHIWSFTHQNFWQDIVRKDLKPNSYLENLNHDLESYFVTDFGKQLASSMLEERRLEISAII